MEEVVYNETIEEWRSVVAFGNGFYEVSNLGRYRSLNRIIQNNWGNGPRVVKGRVMKLHLRGKYWFASLTVDKVRKSEYIHRMVAMAFPDICGEWFDGCQVDHINCDKNDNRASNLRVTTASGNMSNPLTVEKLRNATKNWLSNNQHPNLGKKCSEETKEKISKANKRFTDEELKEHKRSYSAKNKEKITNYYKEYYEKNKGKKRLQAKLRYQRRKQG